MSRFMKRIVVMAVAFSMLLAGSFASGGMDVQASTTPAKVSVKSAKANSTHKKVTVSWKSVKNATGYHVVYRRSDSSVCRSVSVRGTTKKTISVDTNKSSCRIKVRAFRQVKVKGKIKTYYGKWSDVKIVKKKYTPPKKNTNSGSSTSGGNSQNSGGGSQGSGGSQDWGSSQGSGGDVWIPNSGKKYHSTPSCSGMKNPTKVSQSYAESMGYTPCKRCH